MKIEPLEDKLIARIECLRENVDCARTLIEQKLFKKEMECMAKQDFNAFVAHLLENDRIMTDGDAANLLVFAKSLYKAIGRVDFIVFNTRFNIGGDDNGEELGDETIVSFQLKEVDVIGTHVMDDLDIRFVQNIGEDMKIRANYSDQLFDDPSWGIMIYGSGTIDDADENGFGGELGDMMFAIDTIDNNKIAITDGVSKTHSYAYGWNPTVDGMITYAITGETTAKAFRNGAEIEVTAGNSNYSDITIEESFVNLWNGGNAVDFSMRFSFVLFPSDSTKLIEYQSAIYQLYKSTLGLGLV